MINNRPTGLRFRASPDMARIQAIGHVVDIKPTRLDENHAFVADCCRYQEGILSEANMKLKYGFADKIWADLGDNTALLEAVEDEKIRKDSNRATKTREGAVVGCPSARRRGRDYAR